jgi:anti-anti-sigma factor
MSVASITEQSGRTIVALKGEIDMEEAPKVRRTLLGSLKQKRDMLVDLSEVTYIDSSGIASLIEGLQVARKQKNALPWSRSACVRAASWSWRGSTRCSPSTPTWRPPWPRRKADCPAIFFFLPQ